LFIYSIVFSFGYSTPISQLLTIPPYVAASQFFTYPSANSCPNLLHVAITLLAFAHYSDKLKIRSPFIFAGLTMSFIGLSINISTAPDGVKYFGTFLIVVGNYAAVPGMISWYAIISCAMVKT
jgi:hypothetical protein